MSFPLVVAFVLATAAPRADAEGVASPDGAVHAVVRTEGDAPPTVQIDWRGARIAEAELGLEVEALGSVGRGMQTASTSSSNNDESYSISVGKSSSARDRHNATTYRLIDPARSETEMTVELRVFDDAVAFRCRVPAAAGEQRVLLDEPTRFTFPDDPTAWTLPLESYISSYERHYDRGPLSAVAPERLKGLPLLMHNAAKKVWIAVTEADLRDYAGMYVEREADAPGTLRARLSPLPGRADGAKAIVRGELRTPWRVILVADSPAKLLESNTLFHLNPPRAIADTSWIKPGQTTFLWWSGGALEGVPFTPGVNTATTKHYIDFCAKHGIPYHTLDGLDEAWYGGPIVPEGSTDVTRARPELDLPEVLRYAREKGVRLRLWMHWRALRPQLDEALATYERWGVEGIMIDFMDRDDQEMVAFYHEVAEKAARHKLTVTLHGSYKPTGMERTWPNVLSYEAALNQEYNKWDRVGTPPEHNLLIASIRMLAGPLDYHQGGMRCVAPRDFKPRDKAPPVQGTLGHQLALYVVLQNHLPMLVDIPSAYEAFPAAQFLYRIPATWDETRVLRCDVGERIVVARRSGRSWYVGAMTGADPSVLSVPLDFLGSGDHVATGWRDAPDGLEPVRQSLRSDSRLDLGLPSGGGAVYRIEPARED
ncbi:MAG: glycoside hydrolase family 97 protein [Lacipirellulaceae bacterium]